MHDRQTREELEVEDLYIGTLEGRPPQAYTVATDLREGFYVFVRVAHNSCEPMWLGRVVENPQFDPKADHFCKVLVQWYMPCGKSKEVEQLYSGWNTKTNFKWKINRTALEADYISMDCIMASWKLHKNDGDNFVAP